VSNGFFKVSQGCETRFIPFSTFHNVVKGRFLPVWPFHKVMKACFIGFWPFHRVVMVKPVGLISVK
jgi:hypothetical protein